MKKLICSGFLFALLFVSGNVANAAGNCSVHACPKTSSLVGPWKEYIRAVVGGSQCYSCDSDDFAPGKECAYGTNIGQRDSSGKIVGIYQCVDTTGAYDQWRPNNPGVLCTNSPVKKPGSHTKTYYLMNGVKTSDADAGDDVVKLAGSVGCVYYACQKGYKPDSARNMCIEGTSSDNDKEDKATPGNGSGSGSGGGSGGGSRGGSGGGSGGGVPVVKKVDETVARAESCKSTGGQWDNAGKQCFCLDERNLDYSDDYTCRCKVNYKWKKDKTQGCEIESDVFRMQKCEEAKESQKTSWNGRDCICPNDSQNRPQAFSYETLKCVRSKAVADCDKITGAAWDQIKNTCVCVMPGYEIDGVNMVCTENASVKAKRESEELAKIKSKIKSAYDEIGALSNAKKSVWRDEEGKFNTSRLASDSIAAVVLGTTGALVTSHLVKKKQVEDGFEDIQCTIGGQTVAGWGDEFSVGINQ